MEESYKNKRYNVIITCDVTKKYYQRVYFNYPTKKQIAKCEKKLKEKTENLYPYLIEVTSIKSLYEIDCLKAPRLNKYYLNKIVKPKGTFKTIEDIIIRQPHIDCRCLLRSD
jgi:hypothetical protein